MPLGIWIFLVVLRAYYQKFRIIAPVTFKPTEPVYRRPGGGSTEVQDPPKLLLLELLHNLPKPLDDLMFAIIRFLILRIIVPVLQIDEGDPIEDHLQLVGLEYREPVVREDGVDAA